VDVGFRIRVERLGIEETIPAELWSPSFCTAAGIGAEMVTGEGIGDSGLI
jgi:hypothetical protein